MEILINTQRLRKFKVNPIKVEYEPLSEQEYVKLLEDEKKKFALEISMLKYYDKPLNYNYYGRFRITE